QRRIGDQIERCHLHLGGDRHQRAVRLHGTAQLRPSSLHGRRCVRSRDRSRHVGPQLLAQHRHRARRRGRPRPDPRRSDPAAACRLAAAYLAIVTIAAAEIFRITVRTSNYRDVTGGTDGLQQFSGAFFDINPYGRGQYGVGPVSFDERTMWVLTVGWILVALCCLLVYLLMRSPWGRVLKAIREDEDAVRSLGKNVFSYKMQSLILGGVIGALAGFIFALSTGSVLPDSG